MKAKGQLSLERIGRLDALGFSWDTDSAQWEEMYTRLIAYKKQHKDCRVSAEWQPDLALGAWVYHQRALREQGSLLPDRLRRLSALGWEWAPHISSWEQMYRRLMAYKKQHGHCNVPFTGKKSKRFTSWISRQRVAKATNQLSPERIRQLDALGFTWNTNTAQWEEMYQRLAAYKKQHGHCNASRYERDKSLGNWVYTQRDVKAKGQLPLERIHRLDALGFHLESPKRTQKWEEMYSAARRIQKVTRGLQCPACGDRGPILSTMG